HPEAVTPVIQYGLEGLLPYVDALSKLPGSRTENQEGAAAYLKSIVSYQHPDHDTAEWPPAEK
ncbi:MAG TPA: GFA family protein, partial [Hyphomicrobiales bacterium]|nr:GFA family protein [Hyphomicrobiales bacterium]